MPRLFTAIRLPANVAMALSLVQGGIRDARWIDRENYHLTLRFVGDIQNGTADELAAALEQSSGPRFHVTLRGIGFFGGSKPRSIWAGVSSSDPLNDLQSRQERICQSIGLHPEQRKFTPHVTLARLNSRVSPLEVEEFAARHAGSQWQTFEVSAFELLSSKPSRGGGPYVVERVYELD